MYAENALNAPVVSILKFVLRTRFFLHFSGFPISEFLGELEGSHVEGDVRLLLG